MFCPSRRKPVGGFQISLCSSRIRMVDTLIFFHRESFNHQSLTILSQPLSTINLDVQPLTMIHHGITQNSSSILTMTLIQFHQPLTNHQPDVPIPPSSGFLSSWWMRCVACWVWSFSAASRCWRVLWRWLRSPSAWAFSFPTALEAPWQARLSTAKYGAGLTNWVDR